TLFRSKLLDTYKRARWTSVAEKFLPNRIYLCPVSHVDQKDSYFQHVAEVCAGSVQDGFEICKNLARLGNHVAAAYQLSRAVQSGQPRNKEQITEPNSVRILANGFAQAGDPQFLPWFLAHGISPELRTAHSWETYLK